MKVLLFLLLPFMVAAQSFQELILEYEKDCNRLVLDTIDQDGIISYENIPVINESGNTINYVLSNPDTVWQEPDCYEYKNSATYYLTSSSLGIYDLVSDGYAINLPGSDIAWSSFVENIPIHKDYITRQYVCKVKKREVVPFSEHFWEWIKARPKYSIILYEVTD